MNFNPSNHLKLSHSAPQESNTNPPPPFLLPPVTHDGGPPDSIHQSDDDEDLQYFQSLPPGFRFCPTDEELILSYLMKKIRNEPVPRSMIQEVKLYDQNPAALIEKYRHCGEKEWYFFTPRTKKYRNGGRPKRATSDGFGYWKATGADKDILYKQKVIGLRKALVYYEGKPPKGRKTNWIMHEYRKDDRNKQQRDPNEGMVLDPWVLCRVYKKKSEKPKSQKKGKKGDDTKSEGMAIHFANDMMVDPGEVQNGDDYLTCQLSPLPGDDYLACELPPFPESVYVSPPTNYRQQQFPLPVYAPYPFRRLGQFSGNMPPSEFMDGQMMMIPVPSPFTNMVPGFNPSESIDGSRANDGFW